MSVQSIGQSSSNDWLQQLLASYGQQVNGSQQSMSNILSLGSDSGQTSTASTDASSSSSSSSTSSSSSIGSFNDILAALLSGNGSLSYDMSTGMLTTTGASQSSQTGSSDTTTSGLSRKVEETDNADGSSTQSVTLMDSSGNVVGSEVTKKNSDGSFTTTITKTDSTGKSTTETINGENTADGFKTTKVVTDSSGNVLESGSEVIASDGSLTRSMTVNGSDGQTFTESESFDSSGQLVSTSSSVTSTASAATSLASASSTTSSSASSSSSSSSSSKSSSGSSSSSSDSQNTTTVTTMFTSEGLEQTTTVTDPEGKVVSQSVKQIPFSATADGQNYGSNLATGDGLSSIISQYAGQRQAANSYANQDSLLKMGSQSSSGSSESSSVSVQA